MGTQAIEMFRGDTRVITLTNDGGDMVTGSPTVTMLVKKQRDALDAAAILTLGIGTGIVISSATVAVITITPSDTNALSPGSYYYGIQLIEDGGAVYTLVSDIFVLKQEPVLAIV